MPSTQDARRPFWLELRRLYFSPRLPDLFQDSPYSSFWSIEGWAAVRYKSLHRQRPCSLQEIIVVVQMANSDWDIGSFQQHVPGFVSYLIILERLGRARDLRDSDQSTEIRLNMTQKKTQSPQNALDFLTCEWKRSIPIDVGVCVTLSTRQQISAVLTKGIIVTALLIPIQWNLQKWTMHHWLGTSCCVLIFQAVIRFRIHPATAHEAASVN